jgi:hypothetical protein
VGGNFFQKVKHISVDHKYDPGDGLLVIDTTDGNVTITLPPIAGWPLQDYRIIIPILHVAGSNGVFVQLSGSETFLLGNSIFDLGSVPSSFDFYVINSETLTTYGILSDLTIKAVTATSSNWPASSFVTQAIVPFGIELENTGPELMLYQSYTFGVIASAADGTVEGTTEFTDGDHGLTTGDVITIAGTTSYNDEYEVTVVDDDTFSIVETFVADESGTWIRYARYTVLVDSLYTVSFNAQFDSTGGLAWDATGSVFADGTIIDNTSSTVSGEAGTNKTMNLQPYETFLSAGTVIDVRIDNNTFTGNMTACVFKLEMKAI